MSNELNTIDKPNNLHFWDDKTKLQEIKNLFAPSLTELEFAGFIGMGKSLDLNPFLRELWAVKYETSKPAQIFIGRDGYRKVAQRQREYDYHYAESIYSGDKFKVIDGTIHHEYGLLNRGHLVGAYCIVKRKSSSRPVYCMVSLADYDKNHSNWKTMKETMIKKVAESQALRAAFQETFGGTYIEDEVPELMTKSSTEKLKEKIIAETGEIVEAETEKHIDEPANIDQLTAIRDLMKEKNFTEDRKNAAMKHYGVDDWCKLNYEQANHCIELLEKA